MDMNSDTLRANRNDESSCSAMGGMHQRRLSLSAKWASDKSLAIEYLRRQRDVMTWIESVLKRELPSTDLFEALKSGVVLREMMEILFPQASNCMSPISRKYSLRMAPWKERENISVFLRQCKSIGMVDLSLFCTDDLYEGTNMVQVLFCIQHFMMFSELHAIQRFKRVTTSEPAEFSNQEVELAMSKIERAGMDATAFKGLISFDSSLVVPKTIGDYEKETSVREGISVLSKEKSPANINEGRPEKSLSFEKDKLEVKTEVCNQMSEDKQDVDNPADWDDVHPEQEDSGCDEKEPIPCEDTSVLVDDTSIVDLPSAQNQEILEIIQLVISEMAAEIEEAVTQSMMEQYVPTAPATAFETPDEQKAIPLEESVAPEMTILSTIDVEIDVATDSQENSEMIQVAAPDVESDGTTTTVNEANIEIEPITGIDNLVVDFINTPMKSTEDMVSTQSHAEMAENAVEIHTTAEEIQQPTGEEILDAKAMAKCSCGTCTIM